jgi:MFS family permease
MNIQRWTLVVVCAATAMLMLDIAVVNTALSRIAEDLDTGLSGLQWVVDAYTLALASVVLTAGALADRLGRRRLFTYGLVIFTVASLACALAPSPAALIAARVLQALGAEVHGFSAPPPSEPSLFSMFTNWPDCLRSKLSPRHGSGRSRS